MTPAQNAALRRCAESTEPISIQAGTARVLADQYRYIEAQGDGWILTPAGHASIARQHANERRRDAERQVTHTDHEWARRVLAWLDAHDRHEIEHHVNRRYAEHVARCDHAGVEPVREGDEHACVLIEEAVRSAVRCIHDYDEQYRLAVERGGDVAITYEADRRVPRSKAEARESARAGKVVRLSTYRERRPSGGAA